jgi:hypothetical protein
MQNIFTYQEIQKKFQSEWVLLESPETNERLEIVRGNVLFHSKDRDEVYRQLIEMNPLSSAVIYTGTIPKNTAVIL